MNEITTINTLPADQKLTYLNTLKSIIASKDEIRFSDIRRLYQLFAKTMIPQNERFKILFELYENCDNPDTFEIQIGELPSNENYKMSLAKDMIFFRDSEPDRNTTKLVKEFLGELGILPEQIQFLETWVAWENSIMEKLGRDDLVISESDMPAELIANAGAIGIPLTALYFSGSVIGFSAAGISSGLAFIGTSTGLAAMLGLNPMTAGIAALIVAGTAIKKIANAFFGAKKTDPKIQATIDEMKRIQSHYRGMITIDTLRLDPNSWFSFYFPTLGKKKKVSNDLYDLIIEDEIPFHYHISKFGIASALCFLISGLCFYFNVNDHIFLLSLIGFALATLSFFESNRQCGFSFVGGIGSAFFLIYLSSSTM